MKNRTDSQIKKEAIAKEEYRVFENYDLPPRDIIAHCSDGTWVKYSWQQIDRFGWKAWKFMG